ncbi:MAG: DUF6607 family protein [Planctomycetota bacterium]
MASGLLPVHAAEAPLQSPGFAAVNQTAVPAEDRRAILAMTGEYRVDFRFEETVALADGYELKSPYTASATEFVDVVEDAGDRIVLQHVLVLHPQVDGEDAEPVVIKHWRQDWTYQDTRITRFLGHRVFETLELPADVVAGTWSQAVYQVDDSPRYEAIGRWVHDAGRVTWESEDTWRPLPRREHTKRDDYHVMACRNRHTLTPAGWVHEQDNRKLVLDVQGEVIEVIAHETGINTYRRIEVEGEAVDFDPGRRYWSRTAGFWKDVREAWAASVQAPGRYHVAAKLDDRPVYAALFEIAKEINESGEYEDGHRRRAMEVIQASVRVADTTSAEDDRSAALR